MRDYVTKIDNTAPSASGLLTADEDNVRFEELKKAVTTAGITVDPAGGPSSDNLMLAQAMARYASGGIFGADSGSANAYVITSPSGASGFRVPRALFDGMRVCFIPGNTNTGASTLNAWGLGAKDLVTYAGDALAAAEILEGKTIECIYDEASETFLLAPWCTLIRAPTAKPSYFTAALATPPTITNNTFQKVTGWSASTSGLIDASFASDRLTISGDDAGLWFFYCKSIVATEETVMTIYKNGSASPIANGDGYINETLYGRYTTASGFLELTATDYVEIYQYQRNGGASNIAISSAEWGGHKIRA